MYTDEKSKRARANKAIKKMKNLELEWNMEVAKFSENAPTPRFRDKDVEQEVSSALYNMWYDYDPFEYGGQSALECPDCKMIIKNSTDSHYFG